MKLSILSTTVALTMLSSTAAEINLRGAVSAAIDKETAAEKRQANRDARRARTNPNRSQAEEDAEEARKARQARNSGRGNPNSNSVSWYYRLHLHIIILWWKLTGMISIDPLDELFS